MSLPIAVQGRLIVRSAALRKRGRRRVLVGDLSRQQRGDAHVPEDARCEIALDAFSHFGREQ